MIQRLNKKNLIDIYDFVLSTKDIYFDFYVTFNNERKFLTDLRIVKKILKYHKVYALYNNGIQGLLMIIKDKGFRPYLKILAKNSKTEWDLMKFYTWNFYDETYIKLKINNPLVKTLQKENKITKRLIFGFINKGFRGREILLYRPKQIKRIINVGDKDNG
jgi:hypothetical protein